MICRVVHGILISTLLLRTPSDDEPEEANAVLH